jgi:hypothetical protein
MGRTIPSFRVALAMEKEEEGRDPLSKNFRKRIEHVFSAGWRVCVSII